MFLKRNICGAQPLLQHAAVVTQGLLWLTSVPLRRRALVEVLFSAHSEKDVTMVTTKTTFHHHLGWTTVTTNANHCWHSSYSTSSNHVSVDSQCGWQLIRSSAIDQLAIAVLSSFHQSNRQPGTLFSGRGASRICNGWEGWTLHSSVSDGWTAAGTCSLHSCSLIKRVDWGG